VSKISFTPLGQAKGKDGLTRGIFPAPPYHRSNDHIVGKIQIGSIVGNSVAAVMWDYYSVSAEEQRRMVENTIALCEMKYTEQEVNNV
jgi:hypothetical protein